jgi:hypothetical protein
MAYPLYIHTYIDGGDEECAKYNFRGKSRLGRQKRISCDNIKNNLREIDREDGR